VTREPPLFAAEGFGKRFRSRVVLKNASIWAHPGRICVLFGRNGSGKTTLLRCALGQLGADHGVVRFDGRSWERPRLWRLAREGVMYLPVDGGLRRGGQVRAQLDAFARLHGGMDAEAVAERAGVAHLLDGGTDALSGGEVKRVALATALARDPRCLIADEPLAAVTPRDQEAVAGMLRQLAAGGCAIIVTGHDVRALLDVADDVVWMTAGTTHGLGSPADALRHDQFRREYLGPGAPAVA
jgi:ABC-type multidrug transport system ATPase subunit